VPTTTVSRRIRRIGLLSSSYDANGQRVLNYDPEITDKGRQFIADGLRDEARNARVKMRAARGARPAPKVEAAPVKGKVAKSKK
jgi:hypothetical protein